MAKGEVCRILPCKNIITQGRKGLICGTHQYRKRMFNSYDLPGHQGMPSFLVKPLSLPEGIVKVCQIHGELTKDDVYNRKSGKYRQDWCKKCILSLNIKRKYKGMSSLDDYDRMLKEQHGVCKLCKGKNNTTRNGKVKRFAIDHCHKTNEVRGLLCSFCNALIGYARDDINTLQSAIEYLKGK